MPYKNKEREKEYKREYYLEHDGKNRIRRENMNMKGKNSPYWKGEKQKHSEGYVLVWVDSISPFAKMRDHHSYIFEHRLIVAKHLGRCLESWELVHHINGVRDDNRIENLELMDIKEHRILGNKTKLRDKLGKFIRIRSESTP